MLSAIPGIAAGRPEKAATRNVDYDHQLAGRHGGSVGPGRPRFTRDEGPPHRGARVAPRRRPGMCCRASKRFIGAGRFRCNSTLVITRSSPRSSPWTSPWTSSLRLSRVDRTNVPGNEKDSGLDSTPGRHSSYACSCEACIFSQALERSAAGVPRSKLVA